MSEYPRSHNGWTDDGSLITASNRQDRCPNCGSSSYRETISREECQKCGLVCDYWGNGTNEVYDGYLARLRAEQEAQEEERQRRQREEWESWDRPHDTWDE